MRSLRCFVGFIILLLHNVSISRQSVLNSEATLWEPYWFTQINYSEWVQKFDRAKDDGSAEKWLDQVSKIFDFDRVKKDAELSSGSKSSCLACKFVINVGRHMIAIGKSQEEIFDLANRVCIMWNYISPRMCRGLINLVGPDLMEVMQQSQMTPAQMCSFYMQDTCPDGYDKRHDWYVNVPPAQKPATHPTKPPLESSPKLKVLQISDTHYDPYYQEGANANCGESLCCRIEGEPPKTEADKAGKWGDYRKCDTPKILFENALKHISETHKDIDYIMWTGDVPAHDDWNRTKEENVKVLKEASEMMVKYFKEIPIYASVGNHESCPVDVFAPPTNPPQKSMSWLYNVLDQEWSRWLPANTSETIRRGAYYSVLVRPGLRIISINGNYCHKKNFWLLRNSNDPAGQLAWLVHELEAAESKGEKVHIIGHVPPGYPDCMKVWSRNFYDIVNRFEATIMAQFYGHTHYDEFEVFYDSKNFRRPLSVGYISPSLTPWENVNPAYRIYYVDGDHSKTTRAIVDYETWKMNLDEVNSNDNPIWYKSYSARQAYRMPSLLPKDWDNLIRRMAIEENLFEAYHKNYYRNTPVMPKCNDDCRKRLLCDMRSGRSYDRDNLCRNL